MADKGVKGNTDWKQYSVKINYNSDEVKVLHFGGLLLGDGKAWFDNFQVFVDEKPLSS